MTEDIRYATCDDLKLAYQVVGDGPIDLVLVTEWATPLESRWEVPAIAGRLRRLATFSRVISFDKRGVGLSDRAPIDEMATPELWVRDLVAVLDAASSGSCVVLGAHEGGQIATLFAASVPDRVDGLILVNTGARLTQAPGYDLGYTPETWKPNLAGVTAIWQDGSGGEQHIAATRTDPWWRSWYARSRRQQASPAAGLALLKMFGELDVRHVLDHVHAPTLVLHREGNQWWAPEHGRYLAEHIAHAQYVELPGADNYWWAGDADRVVDEIEQFVLGERRSAIIDRTLATLLFTDIVGSTEQAVELGDRRWRDLLDDHDAVARRDIERMGGRIVKQLGDGLLATFDGPARAIEGARAIRSSLADLGLAVRAAVHTGEVEPRGDDLGGVAVHLAARILDLAEPGELWASGVVKGLVAGAPIEFTPRGVHDLKGIPGTWDLYSVEEPAT